MTMVLVVPTTMETILWIWLLTVVPVAMLCSEVLKSVSGNGTKNCCTTCWGTWALTALASPHNTSMAKATVGLIHLEPEHNLASTHCLPLFVVIAQTG